VVSVTGAVAAASSTVVVAAGTISVVSATGVAAGTVVSVAGAVAAESSTVVVAAGVVSVELVAAGATGSVLSLAGMVSEESIVPPPPVVASVFALSSEALLVAGTVLEASSGFVGVVTVASAGLVVASVFGLLSELSPSVFVVSVLVLSSPVAADGTTTLVFESAGFFVLSLVASAAGLTAGFFVSLVSTGVLLASSFSIVSMASFSKCPCSYSYSNSLIIFFAVGRVQTM